MVAVQVEVKSVNKKHGGVKTAFGIPLFGRDVKHAVLQMGVHKHFLESLLIVRSLIVYSPSEYRTDFIKPSFPGSFSMHGSGKVDNGYFHDNWSNVVM